jgi:pilus assembly protein FimV
MIRKLSLAVAVATALSPLGALALGLGEIHPQSALNQTFKADIDLLSVTQDELQDVRVSLASVEAFKKAGMDRPYLLTSLRFAPQLTASGKPVISVTSKDPIREPFLNFLVEVNWPKGRLVREFTVLLDPPVTLSRKPAPVAAPVARNQPVTRVMPRRSTSAPAAGVAEPSMSVAGAREYGPVQPNDNLWSIAKQMRQEGESIEQVMMALQNHNPSAFINNNVNNLKVGKILRLPEEADVTAMSKREAREEFLAQTREWKSGVSAAAPSEAGQRQPAAPAPEPKDRLKLISPKPGTGESAEREGLAESEEIERLKQEILLVRESNASTLQENSALQSRVQELEKQIQDIQRLLTLKSDQLAEVQAAQSIAAEKMKEIQPAEGEQEVPAEEPTEEVPAEPAITETERPVAEEVTEPVVPVPEGTVIEEVDIEAKIDSEAKVAEQPPTPAVEPPPPPETEKPAVEPTTPAPEVAKPSTAALPEKKVSYFDGLKENSTLLAIVGGAGVLLVGLLTMIMRRRKEAEAEFAESILVSPDSDIAPGGADDSSSLTSPTDETSFMSDFSPSDIDALQDETGEVDPLSEADVYIAYGRYQQAEELINQAIEKYPEREELKHKLLEIYFSSKKSDEFSALAQELHNKGLEQRQPDAWGKIAMMGKELNPGHALFAGAAAGMAAADLSDEGDDIGLDLGPLTEDEAPSPAEPEKDSMAISEDLDSMDLSGLENLDEMDSESLEADLSLDSEFLNKMDGVEEAAPMEDSDALDIDLSELEVDSMPSGISGMDSKPAAQESGEEPLPFDLSDIEDSQVAEGVVDEIEMEDSEVLDNLDLESIEKELEGISSDLDSDSAEVDELSLLHSHSEDLDLESTDEVTTKLDLARAYIDMGDNEGAKSILEEVVGEGNEPQQKEAQQLLSGLGT